MVHYTTACANVVVCETSVKKDVGGRQMKKKTHITVSTPAE